MALSDVPTPMTLREAVEAAKILNPHVAAVRGAADGLTVVRRLFDALRQEHPLQVFRLLSLMHHATVESVAQRLEGEHPAALIAALAAGLRANPLPDLMNFAWRIGLSTEVWEPNDA